MQIDEMKRERPFTLLIRISGYSSILFVALILLFLLRKGCLLWGKRLPGACWARAGTRLKLTLGSAADWRLADGHHGRNADRHAAGHGHGRLHCRSRAALGREISSR